MFGTTISISKIGQIIRIYSQGNSKPSIAAQAGVSRNTAKKYFAAFAVSGYTVDQFNAFNDKQLDDFFSTNQAIKIGVNLNLKIGLNLHQNIITYIFFVPVQFSLVQLLTTNLS
ncbi:MAG: hypothetical protein EOP43_06695 [Sphingobacteriaceae bacterium]|nr:MAG: hypothetical protein EOP43_06695 [Sphingobacteriaceae bacterium]